MMMTPAYLARTMLAIMTWLWVPTLAFAMQVALTPPEAPFELDPALAGFSFVISIMAGATTLAIRLNMLVAEAPDRPLVKPWLFCLAHMGGSLVAGLAGFVLAKSQGWPSWNLLLAVLLMSFGGAKAIEMLTERWMSIIRPGGNPNERSNEGRTYWRDRERAKDRDDTDWGRGPDREPRKDNSRVDRF